ncbi:hypothetical protein [Mesorhizobium sp. CAU 1732]
MKLMKRATIVERPFVKLARLDSEDPLSIIRQRGVGKGWLERFEG